MKEKIKALKAQAAKAIEQALVAAEEGDMDLVAELETQSDQLMAQAEKMEVLVAKQKAFTAPKLPVLLPQDSPSNGTMVTTPATDGAEPPNPAAEAQKAAQKAAYMMRFGDMDEGVKTVMLDLYGADYHKDRADQNSGFLKFMKHQDRKMTKPEWAVGDRLIMTPEYVEQALKAGQDYLTLKATMVEASDTLLGYVVPVDFQVRVISRLPALTVIRERATINSTSSDRVQFPKATGGDSQFTSNIRVQWAEETPGATDNETNATFGLEDVNINTEMATVPLSKNGLEDTGFNLIDYLVREFSNAVAVHEDNAFLTGTGSGQPRGILPNSLNGDSLGEVSSGSAAALTFDGLLALIFELDSQYAQNAMMLAEKATWLAISQLKDSTGNYLWTEVRGDNASGSARTIRGHGVLQQEAMPTIAANAFPIIFGDFSGYHIWDRIGMSVTRFDVKPGQNILDYELRRRLGAQVVEPWKLKVQKVEA